MKAYVLMALLFCSVPALADENLQGTPVQQALDEAGAKEFYCVLHGQFRFDGEMANYSTSLRIFAIDKSEATRTCISLVKPVRVINSGRAELWATISGFGYARIDSIEIR